MSDLQHIVETAPGTDKTAEDKHNSEMLAKVDKANAVKGAPNAPEKILGKFDSQEALVKAYQELEQKLGKSGEAPKEAPPATKEAPGSKEAPGTKSTEEAASAVLGVSSDALQPFIEALATQGKLSDNQVADLKKLKVDPAALQFIVEGQLALQRERDSKVYAEVGSKENYEGLLKWASEALSPQEIQAYDAIMDTGNLEQMKFAVSALKARHSAVNGSPPQNFVSGNQGTGDAPGNSYRSSAEHMKDMRDSKYATDSEFRDMVEQKLRNSKF